MRNTDRVVNGRKIVGANNAVSVVVDHCECLTSRPPAAPPINAPSLSR